MSPDYVSFSTAMTALSLVVFIAIVAWAYSGKRRVPFDEAARLPFDDTVAPDHHMHSKPGE